MRKRVLIALSTILILSLLLTPASVSNAASTPVTMYYGDIKLPTSYESYTMIGKWDMTAGPVTVEYTLDISGAPNIAYTGDWSHMGIVGLFSSGSGARMCGFLCDWDNSSEEFPTYPDIDDNQDMDDKFNMQRFPNPGSYDEQMYDVDYTSVSPTIGLPGFNPWLNYGVWFDRDGVDPYQPSMWGMVDGGTYNTGGIYQIQLKYEPLDPAKCIVAARMFPELVNDDDPTGYGIGTGFYIPPWKATGPDYYPTGISFDADDTKKGAMQVVVSGASGNGEIIVKDLTVTGHLVIEEGKVTGGGWIDSPAGAYRGPYTYPDQALADWQSGHIEDIFDLTKGDLILSYTVDMSGISSAGWTPVQVGLREQGYGDLDPSNGGWMMQLYQDPDGSNPTLADLDDHLLLVDHGWLSDELDYDVNPDGDPVAPFGIYSPAHAFWFDRDGVDATQATYWNYKDGKTYNTAGVYNVTVTYHAIDETNGTMLATINGESQGFYLSGYDSANPPDTQPVGKTFTGDMSQMQLFFGRGGGGGEVTLSDIQVIGPGPIAGKASFGFVAQTKKGASTPDGQTEFNFRMADLDFHSSSYDWLVIAGDAARYKGWGTVNGEEGYRFMLWAGDKDPDTFRIKIWRGSDDVIIYDNGMNQPISGGQIIIHKSK